MSSIFCSFYNTKLIKTLTIPLVDANSLTKELKKITTSLKIDKIHFFNIFECMSSIYFV